MRIIGFLWIVAGFIVGAMASVWNKDAIQWSYFAPALGMGILGVILARFGHRQTHRSEERLTANMQAAQTSLANIVSQMETIQNQKTSISPYDVRHMIDTMVSMDLLVFVEARRSIAHVYGLAAYAEVMSEFAAGERYLNRVWSASADGYIDEVNEYLDRSLSQFRIAREKVSLLMRKHV
ncbi:MAG: hypothetical protein JW828_05535 [Sedimentisphaerales bacterium]|nr:hypothetical protein [Sedimentisphaerales bacterium]